MIIRCLLVDDEPLALDLQEGYVKKTPSLSLAGRSSSAFQAMKMLDNTEADLIFLDIQMPGLTGMEFARSLKNAPKIIFTTAFEQYALEGFKADALDYLLKPVSYPKIPECNKQSQTLVRTRGKGCNNRKQELYFRKSRL